MNRKRKPATHRYDNIPRLKDSEGYYAGLGFKFAELLSTHVFQTLPTAGCTDKEWRAAVLEYRRKYESPKKSRQASDAIQLGLDSAKKRNIDPDDWLPFRASEGWIFIEVDRPMNGMVLIENEVLVGLIDEAIPKPVRIKKMEILPDDLDPDSLLTSTDIIKKFTVPRTTLQQWDTKGSYGLGTLEKEQSKDRKGRNQYRYRHLKPFLDAYRKRKMS